MGLLDSVFKRLKRSQEADALFRLITGYSPLWSTTPEKIYEMEIIRATIHSFASHCSKFLPEVRGRHWKPCCSSARIHS